MTAVDRYRAVIDELVGEGAKVTIETVRARAGGGSARDISAAVNAWKEDLSGKVALTAREEALADAIADRIVARLEAAASGVDLGGVNAFLKAAMTP